MLPGRVSITPRALEHTAAAIAAGHLGVDRSKVSVRLSDIRGQLAVAITSPLRVPPLGREPAVGMVTRSQVAREAISRDLTRIGGSTVGTVTLRVTGVTIWESSRVV